jgi:ABC-type transport system involved in multi-copper enzyme maturation permease subunit
MTTATPVREGAVTQTSIISCEWIKLRSLRSTWWSLGLTAVCMIGLAWLVGAARSHQYHQDMRAIAEGRPPSDVTNLFIPDAVSLSLSGIILAQLVIGVLGVLVITSEYSSRMVLATFSVVPRRLPVLIGKGIVFAVVTGIVAEVASVIAFLVGQAALSSTHHGATWSSIGAPRAVFGGGLYLILVGLMGMGLGFLLRSTAGAIGTLMGLLLVLPLLVVALPSPYDDNIRKFLPMMAGTQIIQTPYRDPSMLSPWVGLGVMALWAAAALIAGAMVLNRRDC